MPADLARAGLRVLAAEEDLAVELITSLDRGQKSRAQVPFEEGSQISRPGFVGADPELELAESEGISIVSLTDAQQAVFNRLLETHLTNFAAPVAEMYRTQIASEKESLYFAYAVGGKDPLRSPRAGEPLYYRIQSARFLVEFDDTPKEANHVHVVIRSAESDYGRDALREHYSTAH